MAKDPAQSRLPMPGMSRIPFSGLMRPSSTLSLVRPSQLRPPTSFAKTRPMSFSGLRPPVTPSLALTKSSSGERINKISNTVTLVGKTTSTAFKKFFTKSDSLPIRKDLKNTKKIQPQTISLENNTPRPLTRSDTFVRTDSPNGILGDTPMPVIGGDVRPAICESTPLPSLGAKKELYPNREHLDATFNAPVAFASGQRKTVLESTRISSIGFGHTIDIESPKSSMRMSKMGFGSTMDIDSTRDCLEDGQEKKTNATKNMNETKILNKTHCIREQLLVKSDATQIIFKPHDMTRPVQSDTLKKDIIAKSLEEEECIDRMTDDVLYQTIEIGQKLIDESGRQSPISNATYSNPGSSENLMLLDDVSIPSGFEEVMSADVKAKLMEKHKSLLPLTNEDLDDTLKAPDKTSMKLPLNSTMNTEFLIDLTQNATTPAKHMQLLNLTKDYMDTPNFQNSKNTTQLLYMTPVSASCTTTPDRNAKKMLNPLYQLTPIPRHLQSPSLKQAQSDLVLPTRTPDEDVQDEVMDVDSTLIAVAGRTDGFFQQSPCQQTATSLQNVNNPNEKRKSRFSFGLDLTESTLDCSIELVDVSLSSTILSQATQNSSQNVSSSISSHQLQQQLLKKQNSFDLDESLGILTPDQMKEFLDSTATNNTNNNLELPLMLNVSNNANNISHKLAMHQMRMDQTPSPEELPLDPVEVKTDINEMVLQHQQQQYMLQQQQQNQSMYSMADENNPLSNHQCTESLSLHSEAEPSKSESMTKSSVSKISTSFITSVTSVTSLDTGYQGDGEMSRPASRGASDHSPSNGPLRKGVSRQPSFNQQQGQVPPVRRQDPMTDSDFFTESDADDIFNRGDRRAQVIDGQLYGPMLQPSASVFISEDPHMEDSCMESSGIFTDVENRGDDDLAQIRRQNTEDATQDLSPDFECDADSTETVRSNRELAKRSHQHNEKINTSTSATSVYSHGQGHLSSSQTSSTIQSSMSTDRLSAATLSNRTSYCSVDSGGGCVANANGVGEFKSFSSLNEAFDGETNNHKPVKLTKSSTTSTTSWCEQPLPKHLASVQSITSPRKHSSLTSLCPENGVHKIQAQTIVSPVLVNCKTSAQSITDSDRSFACTISSSNVSTKSNNNTTRKIQKTSSHTSPVKYSARLKTSPKSAKSLKASASVAGGGGIGGGVKSPGGARQNSPPAVRKYHHHSPNKWDAVMNQIASNKSVIRKNYNDVKSKVSTRISVAVSNGASSVGAGVNGAGDGIGNASGSSASVSPTVRRSPTNNVTFNRTFSPSISKTTKTPEALSPSPKTLDNKRLMQNVKRGRSYSKDSQKSSQSDVSLLSGAGSGASAGAGGSVGSPKMLAKTPMRAAKKRDVRNLSISPTDLGPPPKTQQTANGSSTRPKPAAITLTQKRFTSKHQTKPTTQTNQTNSCRTPSTTSTVASTPTGGSVTSIKGSPPSNKFHLNTNTPNGGSVTSIKGSPTTNKYQPNIRRSDPKVIANIPHQDRILNPSLTPQSTKTNGKPETSSELQEDGVSLNNNNNNIHSTSSAASVDKSPANIRTVSRTSSPVLSGINNKKTTSASSSAVANYSEKKISNKLQNPSTSAATSSSVNRKSLLHKQHQQLSEDVALPSSEPVDDLQQLKLLNRHSYNGALNYETFEQQKLQLQQLQQQNEHNTKSTEALGVLLQYLVYELDAFACPSMKSENATAKEKLHQTLILLDEVKSSCSELQDQLCDKDTYYTQRENELQALHRCEMEKAHTNILDMQSLAKHQIEELQNQLESYRREMEYKLSVKQTDLKDAEERERSLQQRIQSLEASEQELKERLTRTESNHANRLQLAAEREQELNDRLKTLTKELDKLKASKESSERDLKEKLHLSHDEVSILRTTRRSLNDSSISSPRNTSSCSAMGNMEMSRLESEAESLRCVLELKQKEISKLTKQNEELLRDADEKLALQAKISLLESQNEMLHLEVDVKSEKEKEYMRQIDEIQKAHNHEITKRTRLTYDNEALQWQLKQRSEQLHLVESKLHELSAQDITSSSLSNRSSVNGSALNPPIHIDETSPPTSPVIKGVIEKNDSVSWVLEMDDETPEVAASKMVKRAGSFRSVERSPSMRRHLSVSASAAQHSNTSLLDAAGPNPLSQSMSATSVIKEHSKVEINEFSNRSHLRTRSQSVSVKSCEGLQQQKPLSSKLSRQLSSGSTRQSSEATTWKEPTAASSPYCMRPRTSTMKTAENEHQEEVLFRRSNKLITCDTSSLNKGERLEMRSLPTHPSVQDLKAIKKCQEIQESAGEAMVSGTNSEDESCSASSDDIVSTASSSANSDTTNSSNQMKNTRMSIEDVLLIEKINSLSGTPMEVSWSDDADGVAGSSTL